MCRSKIEEATEAMVSEMSLTTRKEVAPVKCWGEPRVHAFSAHRPVVSQSDRLRMPRMPSLHYPYSPQASPAESRRGGSDQTPKPGARKLGLSNFRFLEKSCGLTRALTISTFNRRYCDPPKSRQQKQISTPHAHGGGHSFLFQTQL